MTDHDVHSDTTIPHDATRPRAVTATGSVHGFPVLPGYEILGELGRGGMGVVYKARQLRLNRLVALKMILQGAQADPAELQRFQTEAEAIARLQHPGIVQVYEVGQWQPDLQSPSVPWFSLEFCAGGSLSEMLRTGPLPPRQAATLIANMAQAVQHAHERGIVHRDLKPANVLISPTAEPAENAEKHDSTHRQTAAGTPGALSALSAVKLTDFGLAKRLDVDLGQTRTGAVMGTPSYMAPEQAGGQVREIGPHTDVHALGAILYEMLTGRPPFRAATMMDTLFQVLQSPPAPPRLLNPAVERDLETICLKCLEKEPHRRYASAAALADDLDRYLRGDPISIRSINILDRVRRSLERSQVDASLTIWGNLILLWAVIVLLVHLVGLGLILAGGGREGNMVMYALQFVLMVGAYYWYARDLPPRQTTAAETQLWVVWGGYLLAVFILLGVVYQLPHFHTPELIWVSYPFASLLTGLAFFVLGASHLGQCYTFGVAFMALAVAMPMRMDLAQIEFGLLWTIALGSIGLHLRRLGREAEARES